MRASLKRGLLWAVPAAGLGVALLISSVTRARSPAFRLSYRLSPGDRLIYAIRYQSSSQTDFRNLFQPNSVPQGEASEAPVLQAQSYRALLNGELAVEVLKRDAAGLLCAVRVMDPSVELNVDDRESPARAETVALSLARDIFAEMSPRGRIVRVLVASDLDTLARGFIFSVLSKIQFVLPEGRGVARGTWQAEEDDPNGRYLARYVREEPNGVAEGPSLPPNLLAFRKTRTGYLPQSPGNEALLPRLPTVIHPGGGLRILFDTKGGFVDTIEGSETERVTVSGREVALVESRIALRCIKKEAVPAPELRAAAERYMSQSSVSEFVPLSMALSEKESEQDIQRTALGQATLDTLTADLARAEADGLKSDTSLYLKFKALVYLHPEVSPALGKLLSSASPGSLTGDILGGALAAVGNPSAQAVLAQIILARRSEPEFVLDLIQDLARVRFPTEAAERAFRELASGTTDRRVYEAALFGLGTMSRNLKETSPERAAGIADWLASLVRPAMAPQNLDTVLKALGNSGSGKALPVLREFSRDPSSSLRAAAVTGLRFVGPGEADDILAETLASDADASVRAAALLALSFRPPTARTLQAEVQAVLKDSSESVRLAALENLGRIAGGSSQILAVIKRVADADPSESVRKSAAAMLSNSGEKKRS
jgi:HEAT repeat protein